ncbi:MAG TPA: hypothetical protein VGX68_13775 [Thermoanaerobaculia bacterium]|nr:hypothetical protein [Thermoanaerobaculia bacterium]
MAHLTREEMEAFCAGKLTLEDEGRVVEHLILDRCPECLAAAPPQLPIVLMEDVPSGPPLTAEQQAAYEIPIAQAFESFLQEHRRLRELQPQTEMALRALRAGRNRPKKVEDLAYMRALLARSWEFRFDDPKEMVHLAWEAVQISCQLDPCACGGRKRVSDHQSEAHAGLGNAYRVADQYKDAQRTLASARRLFEQGTRSDHLEVRLLDLEASLLGDLHEFAHARAKLKQVLDFHTRNGNRHLAGRTLIKIGLYEGYSGNLEMAISKTRQSLKLIDHKGDPALAFIAAKNLIYFLVENGEIREAKKQRLILSNLLTISGGRIEEVKLRAVDACIAAGLGQHQRAESLFREVREGFAEVSLPILAGIASLDLGAALLRQGKTDDATETVLEATSLFIAHRVRQEALGAVILLRDTFRRQLGTLEMVEEVAAFLRRIECDPSLRFDAQAWEE